MDGVIACIEGRNSDAEELSEQITTLVDEAGLPGMALTQSAVFDMRVSINTGKPLDAWLETMQSLLPMAEGYLCLFYAIAGRRDESIKILERYVVNRPGIGTDEDETRAGEDAMHLEAAVITGHHGSAQLLNERFINTGQVISAWLPVCILRLLGGVAALLERYDDAREHYKEAFKVCTEMNFRPELALTHLNFAELLFDHFPKEKAEALEHLDFAIKEFREMKMQPSLERALRRKDILKA